MVQGMIPPDDILSARPDVQAIKERLLKHGGKNINVPDEWLDNQESWHAVMAEVYQRGRPMDPTRLERRTMEHNECHKNTTTLFLNDEIPSFATGFALYDDIWYYHSWGLSHDDNGELIVETHQDTFAAYFGASFSEQRGKAFADGLHKMVVAPRVPYSGALFNRKPQP